MSGHGEPAASRAAGAPSCAHTEPDCGDRLTWLFRRQPRSPHPLQVLLRRYRAATASPEQSRVERTV